MEIPLRTINNKVKAPSLTFENGIAF